MGRSFGGAEQAIEEQHQPGIGRIAATGGCSCFLIKRLKPVFEMIADSATRNCIDIDIYVTGSLFFKNVPTGP